MKSQIKSNILDKPVSVQTALLRALSLTVLLLLRYFERVVVHDSFVAFTVRRMGQFFEVKIGAVRNVFDQLDPC